MFKKWFNWEAIDYMLLARLIMIFLVVRQHLEPYLPDLRIFNLDFSWLWFGNIGSGEYAVIFFFSLSAFLHTKILLKDFSLEKIKEFYVKRLSKLLPLFYITNLIYLFSVHKYLLQGDINNIIKIFTFQYYLEFDFNQVIWFVNVELMFIILLPGLIYIFFKNKYRLDIIFTALIICLIYFSSLFNFASQTRQYYIYQIVFPILSVSLYNLINKLVDYFHRFFINDSALHGALVGIKPQGKALDPKQVSDPDASVEVFSTSKRVFYILFLINLIVTIYPWPWAKYQVAPFIIISYLIMFKISSEVFTYQKMDLSLKSSLKTFASIINYIGSITYPILLIHMLVVIKLKPFLFQNLGYKLWNFGVAPFLWSHIFTFVIFAISIVLAAGLFELVEKPIYKLLTKKLVD
ncbi:MAG: acyltransferase family protein [bacterium]